MERGTPSPLRGGQGGVQTGKELDDETGYSYFGARYYDPIISIWLSVDPLSDKYPEWSPYHYAANNPIGVIDIDGRDWLKVTGGRIIWYGGKTGDESQLIRTYKATSGYDGYQQARYQNVKDAGPTPEGLYSINLKPDPDRKAVVATNGEIKRSDAGGIENMVDMPVDGRPNARANSSDWGKNRAKLDPINVTGAKSSERDNSSYYLHDSQKGYTHGCTETETALFDDLKDYRTEGNDKIEVVVKYLNPNQSTNGGTAKSSNDE